LNRKAKIKQERNTVNKKSVLMLLSIGGILTAISLLFLQFYIAWFCFIPLFFVLEKASTKQSFLFGLTFGIIVSLLLFYWVFPVAARYSGGFTFYSLLLYLAAIIYFSLYFGLLGIGYRYLRTRSRNLILTGISIAAFYTLLEFIKMHLLQGMPWFRVNLALTQAQNKWAIQWASLGGFYIIIFFIVCFNYLLTQFLYKKDALLIKAAIAVWVIFFGCGFLLSTTNNEIANSKFNTVLLNENISAETRWNNSTGDSLANIFFKLNNQAVKYNPDLIIWSEAAIPWKFEPDDEFIPEVLKITYRSKADHLLGIFSPSKENDKYVYNSAYLVKKNGRITGRYDKTILLDLLEKPFSNSLLSMLPFINTGRYDKILPGRSNSLINSGTARIGVLICNESVFEDKYLTYIKEGANLLVLMSNDAWFENTPLQKIHFYYTRIEAVMAGRDVVINSNRGVTGIIRASGDTGVLPGSNKARIVNCEAHLTSGRTVYSGIKDFTVPFYLIIIFFSNIKRRK
jgi:apolipoprotein N-acyltransferase